MLICDNTRHGSPISGSVSLSKFQLTAKRDDVRGSPLPPGLLAGSNSPSLRQPDLQLREYKVTGVSIYKFLMAYA